MDAYQHLQHEEDLLARLARGETISEADMLAHCEEHVQFLDEQRSVWWQSYLLGDMTPAALREEIEEIQAITRTAHRYVQQHDWCAFLRRVEARACALVGGFLARLDATEALRR